MYKFSFSSSSNARMIASIYTDKKNKTPTILYLHKVDITNDVHVNVPLQSLITIKKGTFQCIPNVDIIEKIYISGPSGAGKSYWASNWIKQAKKYIKYSELYVFSLLDSDKVIDKLNPIRIDLDEYYIDNPLEINEIENNSVLFDDTDMCPISIKKHINQLRDQILEIGRHKKIRIIITSHIFTDFKATRKIMAESNAIVIYPNITSPYYLNIFLKTHGGFTLKQIEWIKTIKSRWICLYCTEPRYIIWETGVVLNSDI